VLTRFKHRFRGNTVKGRKNNTWKAPHVRHHMEQGLGRSREKKGGGVEMEEEERVTLIDIPKGWTKERRTTGRVSALLGV
jgi:hypothetical protein